MAEFEGNIKAVQDNTNGIKENEKNSKKKIFNIKEYTDIILLFPESVSSDSLTKEFILSKNDIRQSKFLSALIENYDKNNDKSNENDNFIMNEDMIKIPSNLYSGVRYIDLVLFIDLWKGKETLNELILNDKIHNLKAVKKLCDSLTLNEDLYFVKKLMKMYPYEHN